jgi:predicted phosphodiesterase
MKLAVLSDIHGNVWALEAVLAHLRSRGADAVFNLGNTLYGPLKPRATFEMLLHENIEQTVLGNQDRRICEATHHELAVNPTLAYVIRDLGDDPIRWLSLLPRTSVYQEEIFLCHGAPRNDAAYLLEDVMDGQPVVRSEAALEELMTSVHHPVVLCGHAHIARVVQMGNGQLLVNPGSVGLPAYEGHDPVRHRMETFSPHASYAMLEKTARGWNVSLERVAYDYEKPMRQARDLKRDDWARGLATGRMR